VWGHHCFGEGVWALLRWVFGPWGSWRKLNVFDEWLTLSSERCDVMADGFVVRLVLS
jgi:hypothetical protein